MAKDEPANVGTEGLARGGVQKLAVLSLSQAYRHRVPLPLVGRLRLASSADPRATSSVAFPC